MSPLPAITGLGFITSIGNDRASVLRSLRELRHGFEPFDFLGNPAVPVKVAGTVKHFALNREKNRIMLTNQTYVMTPDVENSESILTRSNHLIKIS